jgi:tetratricopeptide (TPR) repeat protein
VSVDELIDAVEERVRRCLDGGDAEAVLGEPALRDAALLREAVARDCTPEQGAQVGDALYALGWFFFARVAARGSEADIADVARAIGYLADVTDDPADIPAALHPVLGRAADPAAQLRVGGELLVHASITEDTIAFDAAVRLLAAAVPQLPEDHADRPSYLFALGRGRHKLYDRRGMRDDMEEALACLRLAVSTSRADHPDRAWMLSTLSMCHLDRYLAGGATHDLDAAVAHGERAVAAAAVDDPERSSWLGNLATAYRNRFWRNGARSDLERALSYNEQAVAADTHPAPGLLTNLGLCYIDRYAAGGTRADVDRGIDLFTQALVALPEHHPDRHVVLHNAGLGHQRRYQRAGSAADLDAAVAYFEQAVALVPAGFPERSWYLSNLGVALQDRYRLTGVLADLDLAIDFLRWAVDATAVEHPDRTAWLGNLASGLLDRFRRTRTPADLDEAISRLREALATSPEDHPNRPMVSAQLGVAYGERHLLTRDPADLDRAIRYVERALAAHFPEPSTRRMWLSNLGAFHQRRFERVGDPADLRLAVECFEQTVDGTTDDDADRAMFLCNLAAVYLQRLQVHGHGLDHVALEERAQQVTSAVMGTPVYRVMAGHQFGALANALGEYRIAARLLDDAVTTLPLVSAREAGWGDREHRLGRHLGVATEAVAAHCALGDPVGAVEVAELGRGVLLAAHLDSRTDLTRLAEVDSQLAARFGEVRDRLSANDHADRSWWVQHDDLVSAIRQLPGFDRFLLPPRLTELRPAAGEGAVVLVNAGERRSDAIIVTAESDPILVPLPDLEMKEVRIRVSALLSATTYDRVPRPQDTVAKLLGWLWDAVTEPVLTALPTVLAPSTGLPRVWWMPTGLLGLLPLHASGHPGRPGALDAVVSSYTPTLRALAHARARRPATTRRQLAVTLTRTPDLPDLPGAANEAASLRTQPDATLLNDVEATSKRVMAALADATWAHFACHASTDLDAPSEGGLMLHDGVLRIPDLSRLRLAEAELAYLSACSTAHRGINHVEESVNLASALHLAGFRHVIASLWLLQDAVATVTARAFYRHLPATASADKAAGILHGITRDLRNHRPDRPDLWASLIHSGP